MQCLRYEGQWYWDFDHMNVLTLRMALGLNLHTYDTFLLNHNASTLELKQNSTSWKIFEIKLLFNTMILVLHFSFSQYQLFHKIPSTGGSPFTKLNVNSH